MGNQFLTCSAMFLYNRKITEAFYKWSYPLPTSLLPPFSPLPPPLGTWGNIEQNHQLASVEFSHFSFSPKDRPRDFLDFPSGLCLLRLAVFTPAQLSQDSAAGGGCGRLINLEWSFMNICITIFWGVLDSDHLKKNKTNPSLAPNLPPLPRSTQSQVS